MLLDIVSRSIFLGCHLIATILGIILILKKKEVGLTFLGIGLILPALAGLRTIGLAPNNWILIIWFLVLLLIYSGIDYFLRKKIFIK